MAKATRSYSEGDIPMEPLSIQVNYGNGTPRDLSGISVRLRMIDTDNNEVDLRGASVNLVTASQGRVLFSFPEDRSLFHKHGDYIILLEMNKGKKRELTNQFTIRVRRPGEVYR